ncbi:MULTISPECIES: restriction endonuclease subunit S [unclassified Acinetobacter]|uniref:restriction endonuclease subunit S n=1 Tax=unclassified Acinetobacter TaxID=196816 RepID=UPI0015D3375C|nr:MULTISPECIES: restriction endonuclease subunit S [unclassified Acinetobacter]
MSVPKLRFKAFDGDWSETLFQDLFIFKNGVNASKEQYGSGIKFINVLDIINNPNGITYDSIIGSVNITSKEIDKNLVKYGDVLFQRSSETREEVGQSNVYLGKDPVVFGGFVIRGSAQKEYDPIFMNGLLKTDSLRDQITQLSGGSTRFNIGQDSLNKVSAYLPLKEEQTKIASFLSAVDEKISQLTQKHELLSQYKQGMMQKLFSQQIRFKADDGSEFGEWENSYIGNECKITTGNKDTQNKVDDGLYPFFVRSQTVEKINSYSMDCEAILTSGDGVGVGKNYHYINDKFDFHQRVYCLYEFSERLIGKYLYIYFSNYFYDRVKRLSAKNSVDSVRMDMISKMEIKLPCLEEQTKIANFLPAIDQKLEVVAQQIEQAKQWKKGLLQQMFV